MLPILQVADFKCRGIARVDYDVEHGWLDVQWVHSEVAWRYRVDYSAFRGWLLIADPIGSLQACTGGCVDRNVQPGVRLRDQQARVRSVSVSEIAPHPRDLMAALFLRSLAAAGEGRDFVFG